MNENGWLHKSKTKERKNGHTIRYALNNVKGVILGNSDFHKTMRRIKEVYHNIKQNFNSTFNQINLLKIPQIPKKRRMKGILWGLKENRKL